MTTATAQQSAAHARLRPPVAVPVMRIPRWRALDSSGVAHAFMVRKGPAACGAPNQDERFDHPRRSKCAACVTVVAS